MIKLYGPARSSSGRCLWCLEEVGQAYEHVNIDMRAKEHKADWFLKINPMGKVPALEDGDLKLFESFAINFYLADKYKPELLGKNSTDRGLVHQWSFWASSEVQGPLIEILIQKMFMPDDKRDQKVIDSNMEQLPVLFTVLDNALAGKKYLVGEQFSLADLNVLSVVSIAPAVGFDISAYRNVMSWMKGVSDRPAFQKYSEMRK